MCLVGLVNRVLLHLFEVDAVCIKHVISVIITRNGVGIQNYGNYPSPYPETNEKSVIRKMFPVHAKQKRGSVEHTKKNKNRY